MKEIYVLSERTDLNNKSKWDYQNYRSSCEAFSSFDEAKTAMRKRIVELNKNGILTKEMKNYMKSNDTEELEIVIDIVNGIGTDENYTLSIDEIEELSDYIGIDSISADFGSEGYTDYMLGFGITNNEEPEFICHGYDDGPSNGVNPYIYINCFSMNDTKKRYSFHFEDLFDEYQNFTSHIFLDLTKVKIKE